MKLLIVTQSVDREDPNLGAFYYWFQMLARNVSSLTIIAGRVGITDFPPNVSVHSFGKDQGYGRMRRIGKFWELFSHHFALSDAVLFHQIPEFVIASAPFLIGRTQIAGLWYAHGKVSRCLRLAERLVDHILTSSEAGFRMPSKKVHHLGQAINTDLFCPAGPEMTRGSGAPLRLITVGRIAPVKDYETILNACRILRDTWPLQWTLSIVGGPLTVSDHRYEAQLKKMVRDCGLEEYITFCGERGYSEIPELLRDSDIFLNASRTGSLDKAVLEAMACGLAVLTFNEAYRTLLPSEYFLIHKSPAFLAERVKALRDEPRPNEALRAIVVRDHGLEATIHKIIQILGTRV